MTFGSLTDNARSQKSTRYARFPTTTAEDGPHAFGHALGVPVPRRTSFVSIYIKNSFLFHGVYYNGVIEKRQERNQTKFMNKINYQKRLEETIDKETKAGHVPTLFLHSCCAPCSSYVLEYLSNYFKITVFYYNPNITEETEYKKRVAEQARLISELDTVYPIQLVEGTYDPQRFMRSRKEWSRWTRAVSAALPVIGCV